MSDRPAQDPSAPLDSSQRRGGAAVRQTGSPAPRLLLLREEAELSRDSTVGALGLGIADILECVVMAESDRDTHDDHDVIKVRLQGKDRAMTQEFTLRRALFYPLFYSLFTLFLSSGRSSGLRRSSGFSLLSVLVRTPRRRSEESQFHFDGSKLSSVQTPEQLDMEDGDIIEVWA
ncbi:hypothetical protein WMY93_001609 [Mugilogobius chulae]|uniref:NFATC2-interacting protein n=1 Tax=Mugilogobius chulae TaxID=88201 RepID=A0AAW0PR11_9GOBI